MPADPFAQLLAARFYWREVKLDRAVEFYRLALEAGGDGAEIWMELGAALDASGQLEQAVEAFRQALQKQPGNPSAASHLSSLLKSMERHDEALEVLQEAAQERPDSVELLAAWGDLSAEMWRTTEAERAYERAVALAPHFSYGRVGLARKLARRRRYAEAEAVLVDLLDSHPDYQPARLALGRLLAEQARTPEALEMLEQAAKSPHYEVAARLAMAGLYCRVGEHSEAVRNARLAVSSRPDARGYAALARAFAGLGEWENAQTAVKKAQQAAPGAYVVHLAAAEVAAARGQDEPALEAARQALKLNPYSVEALALAGAACLKLDRPQDCAAFWQRAAELNPWDAKLHWELAEVLRTRLDDLRCAIEHYCKHIELKGSRAEEADRLVKELQAQISSE